MNHRLNELHLRRGRLLERIASQRVALSREVQPVRASLFKVDSLLARAHAATNYIKRHPSIAVLAVSALFIMKTGRVLGWAKRGFLAWQTWRTIRDRFLEFGERAGS
jgi:hypothetical protein